MGWLADLTEGQCLDGTDPFWFRQGKIPFASSGVQYLNHKAQCTFLCLIGCIFSSSVMVEFHLAHTLHDHMNHAHEAHIHLLHQLTIFLAHGLDRL